MEQKIRMLIKENMAAKNKIATITYKNILETAQKTAKKTNAEVTEEMLVSAVKNEIKQLNDLLEFVQEGSERHAEVMEKLGYCKEVLPIMANTEEMAAFLAENAVEKNMGACMKALKAHFGANMDGKEASAVAKTYCN